jgi:hypothetical protein
LATSDSSGNNGWLTFATQVLNSGFFLWFLSLVALTGGGAYFSALQQCIADADRNIDAFQLSAKEISFCRDAAMKCVGHETTIEAMETCVKAVGHEISKYKDSSLVEVYRDFDQAVKHIEIDDRVLYCSRDKIFNSLSLVDGIKDDFLDGKVDDPLDPREESPAELKKFVPIAQQLDFLKFAGGSRWRLNRNCTISTITKITFGYNDPKYVSVQVDKYSSDEKKKLTCDSELNDLFPSAAAGK